MSATIFFGLTGVASQAKVLVAAIQVPEPDTMLTLAVYAAGLGLFVWYYRRRAKRSRLEARTTQKLP
jgi:hypothetical protein